MVYIAADGIVGGKKSLWMQVYEFFASTFQWATSNESFLIEFLQSCIHPYILITTCINFIPFFRYISGNLPVLHDHFQPEKLGAATKGT